MLDGGEQESCSMCFVYVKIVFYVIPFEVSPLSPVLNVCVSISLCVCVRCVKMCVKRG